MFNLFSSFCLLCHVYFLNGRKLFPLNSIRKLKTFEIRKVFDGLMTYLQSEMLKSSNYGENFTDGSEKSVRIMEVFELRGDSN